MEDIEAKVAALVRSPLGCAFLLIANASGLSPYEIARPVTGLYMGAMASRETEVWRTDRDEVLREVMQRGPKKADLARAILARPSAAWWYGPLDRERQVWVSRDGSAPDPARLTTPSGPPSWWERYAQKPTGGFYTSTLYGDISSIFAALDEGVGDIMAAYTGPPFACWRLKASPSARVLEIDGPEAWHALCVRYPADGGRDRQTPDFSGDAGRLVPDWSAVASDWDGVHLTFGGLLSAEQVRVESPSGWTYHWGWDCEQTLWLRWQFTGVERIGDHVPIEPLRGLVHPEFRQPVQRC